MICDKSIIDHTRMNLQGFMKKARSFSNTSKLKDV